ncbi:DUF6677 family protein [Virgibacillus salexigens]|uniref:Sugar ABC transporter permease n=1 Tax=Virgibacillus kapii TaxID=1638645 RepID=A0ABQ2DZ82_9BACI|nr:MULTISPECIES: DUF6677 family protein [Virgibacillus]MYL43912.1 sugar ABC transporter permease [Virgibacillus massiliensis]GGJ77940.1 hypothetical protein GCM10007111_44280 [Virgibacillus kapii]
MKKTWLSLLLSFIFPGLGHLYLGLVKKGVLLISAYILSLILSVVVVGIFTLVIVWVYSLIDSFIKTSEINNEVKEDNILDV